jgi:hypothetical protein
MKYFLIITAVMSTSAFANAELSGMAKQVLNSGGYWCEGNVKVSQLMFGNTANRQGYRVFCDAGNKVASYDLWLDQVKKRFEVQEQ